MTEFGLNCTKMIGDESKKSFSPAWALKNDGDASSTNSTCIPESSDGQIINGKFVKNHGIHWLVASSFVIADMAGGGIVVLPAAAQFANFYLGLFFCYLIATLAAITALLLATCWDHLTLNWAEYRRHVRNPYAEIAFRALGPIARVVISITLNLSQFGICVVFFLLTSQNLHSFVGNLGINAPDICLVVIAVGIVLLPFIYFKSPENFWWIIVGGMACTGVAIILIVAGESLDFKTCEADRLKKVPFDKAYLFSALGAFLFTYAGHSAFPTIQHDMRRPSDFKKSIICAFFLISVAYLPVMLLGHYVYGDSISESVIESIRTVWIKQAVNLLIAFHCMLTLLLMLAFTLLSEAENLFRIPQDFGIKRVLVRTSVLLLVIIVAETVPNFGPVLNLMGSTTMTCMFLIYPSVIYLFLTASIKDAIDKKHPPKVVSFRKMIEKNNKLMLLLCGFLILFGIVGGSIATYTAWEEIGVSKPQTPCFLRPFRH